MKSCECIEFIENNGIEMIGIEAKLMTEKGDLNFRPTWTLKVKQGKNKQNMPIKYCPFCGRDLHEVTDETRAERKKIAETAKAEREEK